MPLHDRQGHFADLDQDIGSSTASDHGQQLAVTSPRGGSVMLWVSDDPTSLEVASMEDGCKGAALDNRFIASSGHGTITAGGALARFHPGISLDNHMIAV